MRLSLLPIVTPVTSLLCLVPIALAAQPAHMVADIATTQGFNFVDLNLPARPAVAGSALYFFADDGIHGKELWTSDGTDLNTRMVRDICPGECSATLGSVIVANGDAVYFAADDGVHGRELWTSDGTAAGTWMVEDLYPGIFGSSPQWLTPLGPDLLFTTQDPDHGRELWKTDGTAAGTTLVADIHPTGSSDPASFATWNGSAYFTARDDAHGDELWATDGTGAGTFLVRDISPGSAGSVRRDRSQGTNEHTPAVIGGHLLFAARTATSGWELWRTDGTESGTELVLDIEPGPEDSSPRQLTPMGNAVYFHAEQQGSGDELWVSDGTAAGTHLVRDIEPGPDSSSPHSFTAAEGTLYFVANTSATGSELWKSDGSQGGTLLVEDIVPGPTSALSWTSYYGLEAFGNRLLFSARDETHGDEPWVSDGTPEGTFLLADLHGGVAGAFNPIFQPLVSTVFDGRAYFFGFGDGVGYEPWSTDGTETGTRLLADIDQQHSSIPKNYFFWLTEMADTGNTLFFRAQNDMDGPELWKTDGSEAGTVPVTDLSTGSSFAFPGRLTPIADRLLFTNETSGYGSRLWSSDGTPAGTAPITPSGSPDQAHDPSHLTPFAGAVYFNGSAGIGDRVLWRTDGTGEGTAPYLPIAARDMEPLGDRLYLGRTGSLSWIDGLTPGSETRLTTVSASDLHAAETLLFFAGLDRDMGNELWVSDGTEAGTVRVRDILPGPEGSMVWYPSEDTYDVKKPPFERGPQIAALPMRDAAFFIADDGVHGAELWWSDGTKAGTYLVRDIDPGPRSSDPRYLTLVRGIAYFVANDGLHGAELWRSDGTLDGTYLLADLEPGEGSSLPGSLTEVFGHLVFSAWRSDDGRELWASNGTAERTLRLQDIHPGPGSSSPDRFSLSQGRLFFSANDGTHGFEPWALPARPPQMTATMTTSGDPVPGGIVVYTIVLSNLGTFGQLDNPGPELTDVLPPGLAVLSLNATAGTAALGSPLVQKAAPAGTEVTWNGYVPGQESVVITIEAQIDPTVPVGTTLANQATVRFDGDGTGDNESLAPSDDPGTDAPGDPTLVVVGAENLLEIPTTSEVGLAILTLLLALAALGILRR